MSLFSRGTPVGVTALCCAHSTRHERRRAASVARPASSCSAQGNAALLVLWSWSCSCTRAFWNVLKQKPFHGAQQRCQSYCCLESAPLPPHRTGTGASALTIATMRMGAHLALGASVHITQNTTTTITTAHMGARLERARTSPPLRTMTKRVHQHHCTRTLTASSSIGVHVCHGTTHKDEAQPPAAHEHAHAQQSKSVKPYHERALMATARPRSEPTSAGTCAHEAAAMAQRCARVSPHAPGIRAFPLGARREAGDHPVSPPEELREKRELAAADAGARNGRATGTRRESANTTTIATAW